MQPPRHARDASLDDDALLAAVREGDPAARERLARACLQRARRVVFLVSGASRETDDIVQEVLVRVFSAFATWRGEASFGAWVDRITVNTLRGHFRRHPWRRWSFAGGDDEQPAPEWPAKGPSPETEVGNAELFTRLAAHLARIGEPKRVAYVLFAAQGASVAEIAAIVGCNVETAKKRVQHGRAELLERARRDPGLSGLVEEQWS